MLLHQVLDGDLIIWSHLFSYPQSLKEISKRFEQNGVLIQMAKQPPSIHAPIIRILRGDCGISTRRCEIKSLQSFRTGKKLESSVGILSTSERDGFLRLQ
ncbi:hypothetical protein CEXT_54721 [Caerostris extrusa]|uniref:Uncharacterized protein n=1 Tax=Caerostris extrusa TaxID=172846 RepID=A0AAV4UGZ4_CAEEX|nr:hypothetical protein CEXT_54721 [Caerostris extrusa]